MKKLTKVALAMAVAGCFATGALAQTPPAPAAAPAEAPDKLQFEVKTADGKAFTQKDVKGKKTVFVLLQAACGQCRQELGDLKAKADALMAKANLVLVLVDVNIERSVEYFKNQNAPGTIVLDPGYSMGELFDVRATPATVVVDKDLTVLTTKVGYRIGDIDKLLQSL